MDDIQSSLDDTPSPSYDIQSSLDDTPSPSSSTKNKRLRRKKNKNGAGTVRNLVLSKNTIIERKVHQFSGKTILTEYKYTVIGGGESFVVHKITKYTDDEQIKTIIDNDFGPLRVLPMRRRELNDYLITAHASGDAIILNLSPFEHDDSIMIPYYLTTLTQIARPYSAIKCFILDDCNFKRFNTTN